MDENYFKMKCLETLSIQFDNFVQRYERFLHQSIFSMKFNIGDLINSIEFCGVDTIKKCSVRPVFFRSELTESF